MEKKELKFTIFVIHSLADSWHRPYQYVYSVLNDSGILDDYIIKFYDVLHTLGEKYLVEDITGFVKDRGYKV